MQWERYQNPETIHRFVRICGPWLTISVGPSRADRAAPVSQFLQGGLNCGMEDCPEALQNRRFVALVAIDRFRHVGTRGEKR